MKERLEAPQQIRHQIWKELARATQDRHHAWRAPVLATTDASARANARTVVLRAADAKLQQLQIYTDARSGKASELALQPHGMFVFWSARLGWQLRVRVTLTVHAEGATVDAAWARVKQSASASDYLSALAPGSALELAQPPQGVPLQPLTAKALTPLPSAHTPHFAVVNAQVLDIDWLELASTGHRRASLTVDTWTWLVP